MKQLKDPLETNQNDVRLFTGEFEAGAYVSGLNCFPGLHANGENTRLNISERLYCGRRALRAHVLRADFICEKLLAR